MKNFLAIFGLLSILGIGTAGVVYVSMNRNNLPAIFDPIKKDKKKDDQKQKASDPSTCQCPPPCPCENCICDQVNRDK